MKERFNRSVEMDRKHSKKELEVDFIGGEEITEKESALLKDYFAKKRNSEEGKLQSRKLRRDRE